MNLYKYSNRNGKAASSVGCADKQQRSLLADSAVKDVHVGPAEQKKQRMHNDSGAGIRKVKGKGIKTKRKNKKGDELLKGGVVSTKVKLIVSAQICWPFQN